MVKQTRYHPSVKAHAFVVVAAAIAAVLATQPAAAQQFGGRISSSIGNASTPMLAPWLRLHAVNPSISLSTPATSPVQQQMQDDYATSLMSAQRQLLQQNPSGDSRPELSIGNQLNGYMGPH
jgi:hypothetical protein